MELNVLTMEKLVATLRFRVDSTGLLPQIDILLMLFKSLLVAEIFVFTTGLKKNRSAARRWKEQCLFQDSQVAVNKRRVF